MLLDRDPDTLCSVVRDDNHGHPGEGERQCKRMRTEDDGAVILGRIATAMTEYEECCPPEYICPPGPALRYIRTSRNIEEILQHVAQQQVHTMTHFQSWPWTTQLCVNQSTTLLHLLEATAEPNTHAGLWEVCCSELARLSFEVQCKPKDRRAICRKIVDVLFGNDGILRVHPSETKRSIPPNVGQVVACMSEAPDASTCVLHWPFVAIRRSGMPDVLHQLTVQLEKTWPGIRVLARWNNGSNSNHDEAMCLMYNHSRNRDQHVLSMAWWHSPTCDQIYELATVNLDGKVVRANSRHELHGLLPSLLSINPICCNVYLHQLRDYNAKTAMIGAGLEANEMEIGTLYRLLTECIPQAVTKNISVQNDVGRALHVIFGGSQAGYGMWWKFIAKENTIPEHQYQHQWYTFAVSGRFRSKQDAMRHIYLLAKHHNGSKFRSIVHANGLQNTVTLDIISKLGSLTHMDLAFFLSLEFQSTVVCVSQGRGGLGQWYHFEQDLHRWKYDATGSVVQRKCEQMLRDIVRMLKATPAIPQKLKSSKIPARLTALLNFETEVEEQEILQHSLIHLISQMGEQHNILSVVRGVAHHLMDTAFESRLDCTNEHLIPFTNGVLDLKLGELRDGRPDDMLKKGPMYRFIQYNHNRSQIQEVEYIITTIFPDTVLRRFVLDVFSSCLRKRNVNKHFYIISGGTNAGKSFFLQLVNYAFGDLFCTLPITALTSRETDPSGHTDYLARSHGCNIAVCNEPDCATQSLLSDRLKGTTSDSDRMAVREIYGSTREMVITWKLMMACNTIPSIVNCDVATADRVQVIQCPSSFGNPDRTPVQPSEQFMERRFIARRSCTGPQLQVLGQALMSILFENFLQSDMHTLGYFLHVPRCVRLHTEQYFQDLRAFKNWVSAFCRPMNIFGGCISRADEHTLRRWAMYICKMRSQNATADITHQCRLMLKWIHSRTEFVGHTASSTLTDGRPRTGNWVMPMLATEVIVENFNAFRALRRPEHNLFNQNNTIDDERRVRRRRGIQSTLSSRLDPGLIRDALEQITGQQPYDQYWLGLCILTDQSQTPAYSDADHGVGAGRGGMGGMPAALKACCEMWLQKYGVPLPHAACLRDSDIVMGLQSLGVNPPSTVPIRWNTQDYAGTNNEADEVAVQYSVQGSACDHHLPTSATECAELIAAMNISMDSELRILQQNQQIVAFDCGFTSRDGVIRSQQASQCASKAETTATFIPVDMYYRGCSASLDIPEMIEIAAEPMPELILTEDKVFDEDKIIAMLQNSN